MTKSQKSHHLTSRQEPAWTITPGGVIVTLVLLAAMLAWPLYWWYTGNSRPSHGSHGAMAAPPAVSPGAVLGGRLIFRDVAAQSREFLGYHSTIGLTAEQEAIKREVLSAMPAACCSGSSAYTCCCTCNLSKTIWGLSNYALARHHVNAEELRELVTAWKNYTNASGYSGTACYDGRCELPYRENGCGGMSESNLVL